MSKCKICNNSGLLLSVNKHGLCPKCVQQIYPTIIRMLDIFNESQKIIKESKNYKTRLSRCELINSILERLAPYEAIGLTEDVFPIKIQEILNINVNTKKIIIKEAIYSTYEDIRTKVNASSSPKTKINACNNGLLKFRELSKEFGNLKEIVKVETELRKLAHTLEFNSFIEQAKKAEFKENFKKALDRYQEALFFLKSDDIDDSEQKDSIEKLELKISDLKLRIGKTE